MDRRLVVLLALVAAVTARPFDAEDEASVLNPIVEIEREKRQPAESQDRQDYGYGKPAPSYGYQPEPSYKPEPYKPEPYKSYKPHLPAQIKTFVKTDYHANFKWGVKHNIAGPDHH